MRVVIIGNDQLSRDALTSLLNYLGGFRVVASEDASRDPVSVIKQNSPDIVVVEGTSMPKEDIGTLKRVTDAKTIVIRDNSIRGQVYEADAVVNPDDGSAALFRALRHIGGHSETLSSRAVRDISSVYGPPAGLSKRELQVAQFVAKGLPNRRIATILNLQEQSVKNLVSTIMRKLRCENRVQVALMLQGYEPVDSQRGE
jgi:DNA-binding NarL/FixJ family response regulator